MRPKIFVQIASYRDPECQWTVRDLFAKAAHPDRIRVGICWQYDPEADKDLLTIDDAHKDKVRIINVDYRQSQGACWARSQVQTLWQKEEYVLQIDSHMRFEPSWDNKLIAMLDLCPSEKAVFSCYPPPYTPPDKLGKSEIHIMTASKFNEPDGILCFMGRPFGPNNSKPKPIKGMFVAGGFVFGKSSIIEEVPYDPYLYFYGEEISMAVRLWTHGYDIYHPNNNVLFHYYKETGDPKNRTHWGDHKQWGELNERALKRVKHLLGVETSTDNNTLIELDKYGLGTVRSLEEYQLAAGVNFKEKHLSTAARNCEFFGDPVLRRLDQPLSQANGKLMDLNWLEWVHGNLKSGCDARTIRDTLLKAGFTIDTIRVVMGVLFTEDPSPTNNAPK